MAPTPLMGSIERFCKSCTRTLDAFQLCFLFGSSESHAADGGYQSKIHFECVAAPINGGKECGQTSRAGLYCIIDRTARGSKRHLGLYVSLIF